MPPRHTDSVFINCPFDNEYKPLFYAVVFTIYSCNLTPRCTFELGDSGESRFSKIASLIHTCKFGIHDISRTELGDNCLPRFNMPYELGLFLGAKTFGPDVHRQKKCLILDREEHRYQQFLSDIAGLDIKAHGNNYHAIIKAVRDWLGEFLPNLSGGTAIANDYEIFLDVLPEICERARLTASELTFNDYRRMVSDFLDLRQ